MTFKPSLSILFPAWIDDTIRLTGVPPGRPRRNLSPDDRACRCAGMPALLPTVQPPEDAVSCPALADTLLEAIRYEHWLRFYFLDEPENGEDDPGTGRDAVTGEAFEETGGVAVLHVPDVWAEASRRAEPHLYPLLEVLRDRKISMDGARDGVFRHVARTVGADAEDPAFGEQLFQLVADPDFRRGLDAFHGWVQELANGEESVEPGGTDTPMMAGAPNEEDAGEGGEPPSFAAWQAAFQAWAARQPVQHVTTIGPFSGKETL